MVDISIVDGGYKLAYNWRVPHCRIYIYIYMAYFLPCRHGGQGTCITGWWFGTMEFYFP